MKGLAVAVVLTIACASGAAFAQSGNVCVFWRS